MRFVMALMVLGGCVDTTSSETDDIGSTCSSSTRYLGHEFDCDTGDVDHPAGVCVNIGQGAGIECLYKTGDFPNRSLCPAGDVAYVIATDVAHASFCHPLFSGPRDPLEW